MPDAINRTLRDITNQRNMRDRRGSGGKIGTQMSQISGSRQGMGRQDWKAYTRILNQPIAPRDPYKDDPGHTSGPPRREPLAKPAAPKPSKREEEERQGKLVDLARERFKLAEDRESMIRHEALDDLKFLAGSQWDEGIFEQRQTDNRPCLTINRLPQFVRQVTNEERQNRPAIKINPVDDAADIETAEIIEGLTRHIEYASNADAAYDQAFFNAAANGFGYWRLTTEYINHESFEQEIRIKWIQNPFTVYLDPNAQEPDFSDAMWGFVIEKMSKEEYKRQFPDSEMAGINDWSALGDRNNLWVSRDQVQVAEYFYIDRKKATLCQLEDGKTAWKDEVPEGADVVSERESWKDTVRWAKMNGHEVLDETEWAGKYIPIIKVVGDEYDLDGKKVLKGIVRDAKDPQRQFNYMKSALTEAIALAPKAPYVGAEGQFENHEREWQDANVKNYGYLEYKPVALSGTPLPPPQRNTVEPAIQAMNMAMMESADDMKAVTGIYDAALGNRSNEQSGRAILARQQQSQGSNFHYLDNLIRAIRFCGLQILDLIPKIYDVATVKRIIGEDGQQRLVPLNQEFQDGSRLRIYDMSVGTYDVTISTGPSYQTRRQQAVDSQMELAKVYPPLMGVAGDLVIRNMDIPQAQEIAERVSQTIPPQVKDAGKQGDIPPQAQQAIAQLTEQNQQLTQHLNAALQDLETRNSQKQMELESKERVEFARIAVDEQKNQIEYLKVQAQLAAAEAKANAQLSSDMASREYDFISDELDRTHEAALSAMEHQQGMQAQDQQQPAAMAQQQPQPQQMQIEMGGGDGGADETQGG